MLILGICLDGLVYIRQPQTGRGIHVYGLTDTVNSTITYFVH
jgi:hypothetical protein